MLVFFLLITLGISILAVFLFLLYSAFFYTYSIRCSIPVSLPLRAACKVVDRSKEAGTTFAELNRIAPHSTQFAIYCNSPDEVADERKDCVIGCYLSDDPNESKVSEKLEEILERNGYNIKTFPKCTKAIITEYPYRTMLSLWIAVRRVYPSLVEYIQENSKSIDHAGPFFEVYKEDCIQFVVILKPADGFDVFPPSIDIEETHDDDDDNETKKTQ